MKKKETLWELLRRLDEQAGQYNLHLHKANEYFDTAAQKTNKIMDRQEKELHATISKVRRAIKSFMKKNDQNRKKKN